MAPVLTSTQLSVDRPAEGERPAVRDQVVVEGWAWSPDDPPHVTVTIGGRTAEVLPGGWRPDVSAALGIGEIRGFVARGSASGIEPGPAEVVVTATAADGIAVERRRTVEVDGKPARGGHRRRPWAGFAERLDPRVSPGGMGHAEHVARYRWAAQLAQGRAVLDAGCGVGFGAHVLLAAGARSVTGVDAFAGAIVEAREQGRDGLEFMIGDLRDLPLPAERFDLVVCFEAIEHVAEQERVLDEIKRVLRPGGLLAISTPVPGAIAVHNPHHVAELSPEELDRLLTGRFANVALRLQHSAIASVIDVGPRDGKPASDSPPLQWTTGPIEPMYAVALASDAQLPRPSPAGSLAAGHDIAALVTQHHELADQLAEARAEVSAQRARASRADTAFEALGLRHADAQQALERLAGLEQRHAAELAELEQRHAAELAKLEQRHAAELATLEQRHAAELAKLEQRHAPVLAELQQRHAQAAQALEQRHAQAAQELEQCRAQAVSDSEAVRTSRSWQLTAPLRTAARAWRSAAERWRR